MREPINKLVFDDWKKTKAWALGLLTADGSFSKARPNDFILYNTDYELLEYVKEIVEKYLVNYDYKIGEQQTENKTKYSYRFTSFEYRNFCRKIGVTEDKAHTMKDLKIPEEFFPHF